MKSPKPSHRRGEVWWVNLDPTVGTEVRKTRPAIIVSPSDMNAALPRVIIAPLTSKAHPLGCRPRVTFEKTDGFILLDQLRSVDKQRLVSPLGSIAEELWLPVLLEMLS